MSHAQEGASASLLETLQQMHRAKADRKATLKRAKPESSSSPPRLKPGAKRSLLKAG
jgi:hypothetical protein